MQYIVLDLEWNGGYSKKAHGYFNEIIEVGATRVNADMELVDRFSMVIHPVVSKKLSGIVTDLTNITAEDLEEGTTFAKMMRRFADWIGAEDAAVLTWSNTDLLVLMENCRFFYGRQEVPFLRYYMDFQAYAQRRMGVTGGQQLGLAKAGEMLEIPADDMSLHRAPDDSLLTARILQKVYERDGFEKCIETVDDEFYRRVTFKPVIISNIDDPRIQQSDFVFNCPVCGRNLRRTGKWRFHSRAFCAELRCRTCDKVYNARVQCRLKYEGMECRRKLSEKLPEPPAQPEEKPENAAAAASEATVIA